MCPAAAPAAFRPAASVAPAAQRRGVLGHARELDADRVAGLLADDARAHEDVGDRGREPLVERGGDEPGALGDHLARVRGPADAGHPADAERRVEQHRRRDALGRHEALGERDHRRAAAEPGGLEAADDLLQPARGHAEEHVVRAREARAETGSIAQLARQLDARQVGLVLAVGLEPRGLLGRARLQRRAEAAARQQDRDGGAERARADDDGAPAARGRERQMRAVAAFPTRTQRPPRVTRHRPTRL